MLPARLPSVTGPTPLPRTGTRRHHRAPARRPAASDDGWVRGHIAEVGSLMLAVVSVALGFAYQTPALTRPVQRPGSRQVSIVQAIDAIGPVWFLAFVAVGVLTLVGLMLSNRIMVIAHSAGTVIFGMFTAAVWLGWAFSDPRPTIVSPILALGAVGFQWLCALVYSARRE